MIHAYIRVSTKGQSYYGKGEEAQASEIQRYCEVAYPDEWLTFHVDPGVSGTLPLEERPASAKMLDDIEDGDTFICFSVSRISRYVWITSKFLHDMKQQGVDVVCLDAKDASKSSEGALVYHMLSAVSQQDRENILKITEAGREEKRKVGGDLGGTVQPWQKREGKGKDAQIVNDPEKIQKIKDVRDLLSIGQKYDEIVMQTGVSRGTISNWKKQIEDSESEMNKAINL